MHQDSIFYNSKAKARSPHFAGTAFVYSIEALKLVDDAMSEMIRIVSLPENEIVNLAKAQKTEAIINNFRKELKGQNFRDVDGGIYNYQLGVYYMDFIGECEKLGDYLMNVDQAGIIQNNDHDALPLK